MWWTPQPTHTHPHTPTYLPLLLFSAPFTLQKRGKEGNFTFLLYYHKILAGAQHLHSYLSNMIVGVIILHLDLLICCCVREEGGGGQIIFALGYYFHPQHIRYRTWKLLNGASQQVKVQERRSRARRTCCEWFSRLWKDGFLGQDGSVEDVTTSIVAGFFVLWKILTWWRRSSGSGRREDLIWVHVCTCR